MKQISKRYETVARVVTDSDDGGVLDNGVGNGPLSSAQRQAQRSPGPLHAPPTP